MNETPGSAADERWERKKLIIAAAVTAIAGDNVQIRRITEATPRPPGNWARHGRTLEQCSHNLAPHLMRFLRDWRSEQ